MLTGRLRARRRVSQYRRFLYCLQRWHVPLEDAKSLPTPACPAHAKIALSEPSKSFRACGLRPGCAQPCTRSATPSARAMRAARRTSDHARSLSRPRFAVAGEAVAAWFARRVAPKFIFSVAPPPVPVPGPGHSTSIPVRRPRFDRVLVYHPPPRCGRRAFGGTAVQSPAV